VSQTLIVAPPAAKPETASVLPDKLVETTLVLELLDMEYEPLPPETVTDWLADIAKERLFWLKEMPETLPACTMTARFVQSEAVPTAQRLMVAEPSPCPVTVTCVPLIETAAMEGFEFDPK
jgi:hypothetical protein